MNVTGLPEVGYRVVQITHYEPIPKGEKAGLNWAAIVAAVFLVAASVFVFCKQEPYQKPAHTQNTLPLNQTH